MILTQLWLNCISNVRETIWFLDLKIRFLQRLTQSERHDCLTPGQASEKTWLTSTKSNGIFNDQSIIRPLSLMSQSSFSAFPNDPMVPWSELPTLAGPRLTNAEDALTSGRCGHEMRKPIGTLHDFIRSSSGFWGVLFDLFSHRDLMGCKWW